MEASREEGVGIKAAKILYPLFVGQAFGAIITSLTFIVVARILEPHNYGLYTFAFGFSALVNGLLAFGVGAYFSTVLAKLAYKKDGEGILRTLSCGYIIAGAVGVILTLLGIGISGYLAGVYTNIGISPMILMVAAGTIIFSILNTLAVSALIGLSRTGQAAIISVMVDIIQLALSIILALHYGVIGAVMAMLIGYLTGAVVGAYLLIRVVASTFKYRIYIPTLKEIGEVFHVVWPLAATNFLNTGMQNFSILFLGLYVSTAALGNYGAAAKGLALLAMIYGTLGRGLLPIFATAKAMDAGEGINSTYNRIIHFSLIPMLPIIIYVGIMAAPGLYLLVGSNYINAPFFLTLIAGGAMIGLFGTYINQLLISGNHTMNIMRINFISAVFQLISLLIFVPPYQIIGAIFAIFYIGNTIEAVFFARDAQIVFGMRFELRKLLLLYFANVILAGILLIAYVASNNLIPYYLVWQKYVIELLVVLIVAMMVYPALLIIFRAINDKDIMSMRHATNRLGKVSVVFGGFFNYSEYLYKRLIRS